MGNILNKDQVLIPVNWLENVQDIAYTDSMSHGLARWLLHVKCVKFAVLFHFASSEQSTVVDRIKSKALKRFHVYARLIL